MFRRFEKVLNPTHEPERPEPPAGLMAFYWHFGRQVKGLLAALFVIELFVALLDTAVPWFMGRIVTFVSKVPPDRFLDETWPWLIGMALTVLIARPAIILARYLVTNQAIAGPFTNLIRWQSHWHVVRQSWAFFQNDFAGRISNRVMQTGPALRESLVSSVTAIWYIMVYGATAIAMTANADWWLTTPILAWFVGYVALLRYFVPRLRDRSKLTSEARSLMMGRIVDSYTNILTVKLFARPRDEDGYVRDSVEHHTDRFLAQQRLITAFGTLLAVLNALLVFAAGALALLLWRYGSVEVGAIAMVLPLAFQLTNMSRWIAFQVTEIFEEVGVVQEGMMTIAQPLQLVDRAGAQSLAVGEGRIVFDDVRFGYGRESGVLDRFTLAIRPGEKIGLVGRSGAGKSTVINLVARLFDVDAGSILIDGQDLREVTLTSLRQAIAIVSQEVTLFDDTIRANIALGRLDASDQDIIAAAKAAAAHEFIMAQPLGYDTMIGDSGLRLSGGQRQRLALARAILKNAPILLLDEATSALDAESERMVQAALESAMRDRTTLVIAHRLSTVQRADRIVVLEAGQIVEIGTHAALSAAGGLYARLAAMQFDMQVAS